MNHAVTVDDTRIVGVSPVAAVGTDAIRCNAALTIASTGNLTVRGDIGLNNKALNVAGGGVLEFDAHLAGTPSTARYRCYMTNATDPLAILTVTGSSGSHATIRSNAGGANGRFTNNGNDHSGLVDATYCDFLRIGDAANPAFTPIVGSGDSFLFAHCTLDACGSIGSASSGGVNGGGSVSLDHVRMTNSVADSVQLPVDTKTSGLRVLTYCDFDQGIHLGHIGGWTIEYNIIRFYDYSTSDAIWASFYRNIIAAANLVNDLGCAGVAQDIYWVRVGAQNNPHCFGAEQLTSRITGCVFEAPDGTDGAGDCITFGNGFASPNTVTIDHNLVLDDGADNDTGTMLSCLGNANVSVVAHHNTYHGGQGCYFGETYTGYAGMGQVRNNLSWARNAGVAYIIHGDTGVIPNVVQGAQAHHNGVFHPHATNGYDPQLTFTPATQGSSDVNADPQFVDVNRGIKTWDTSLGGPGTVAHALSSIGTEVAGYTIDALLTYVKAGFVPRNTTFHGASDNVSPSNGWIGAVQGGGVFTLALAAGSYAITGTATPLTEIGPQTWLRVVRAR